MRKRLKAALVGSGVIALAIAGGTSVAQDMSQHDETALVRQPMIRGTVTTTAGDHLTIKTDAGEIYTVSISANTRMMRENRFMGGPRPAARDGSSAPRAIKIEEVKVGDGVGAMGEFDAPNKTVHALFVAVMDAEQVKRLREGMGKEYITGKITAIDELKLTVLRSDNVSQVIEVDETTSFRKGGRRAAIRPDGATPPQGGGVAGAGASVPAGGGGESITLADVKVGDMIAGQGSVKHGVFVPTNLTVIPPGAMGPRMRREGASGASSAAPAAAPNQ